MKIQRIIMLIMACAMLSGCNALRTPAQRYKIALDAYTAANAAFVALGEAKIISQEQILASKPYWKLGDAQIAILRDDYLHNRPLNITALRTLENVAFSQPVQDWLTAYLARVQERK